MFKDLAEIDVKKALETYITDSGIDLDTRWLLFCDAPNSVKNAGTWIVVFYWEQKHGKINWYDDFGYDTYATINMQRVINSMEDQEYSLEKINDMKEEILSRNLDSFVNAW